MIKFLVIMHCGSAVPFFCLDRLLEEPAWAAAGALFVVVLAITVFRGTALRRFRGR